MVNPAYEFEQTGTACARRPLTHAIDGSFVSHVDRLAR
jgi:hypothetical protein